MQCDVHRNADDRGRDLYPFLLDVQADLLSDLETRVVVPLVAAAAYGRRAGRLHPQFEIDGQSVVMATHLLAAVRRSELGARVASLADRRDEVIAAVDVLLGGV
jgi:toxin CcdB